VHLILQEAGLSQVGLNIHLFRQTAPGCCCGAFNQRCTRTPQDSHFHLKYGFTDVAVLFRASFGPRCHMANRSAQ
jgi:hypothetical protein